jgi:antitoxin (DNA-binding transcriptional repressor) of toxin-antitoxin stability system
MNPSPAEGFEMTVTLTDAQRRLPDLIDALGPAEELVITRGDRPVARLVREADAPPRTLGTLKGTVTYMAPDFDAPLDDFRDAVG